MKKMMKIGIVIGMAFAFMYWGKFMNKRLLQEKNIIVFLGDSITEAGSGPDGYVTLTSRAVEKMHPDLNLKVINAGISGNRVSDCRKRLKRDVLQKKPAIVVVYVGINDVWHWMVGQGTNKDVFESGLRDIVSQIHSFGAKVILCTPSVIGEKSDGTNRFDGMLDEYSDIVRNIAETTGTQLLDLRKAFTAYLKQHNPNNDEQGILTQDGVHLNQNGNRFVSTLVIDALSREI